MDLPTIERLVMDSNEDSLLLCCDIRLYDDLSLPMIMLQGWFSDQHDCFKLFLNKLTPEEQGHLFSELAVHESVKSKYRQLWEDGTFLRVSTSNQGEHKRPGQLDYRWFCVWASEVRTAIVRSGTLETLIEDLQTVEQAHDSFKPWFYRTKKVRNLNAADAARLLARYSYLAPEKQPLLAWGALRGAAILLNHEPRWKRRARLEREYQHPAKRTALEERAAKFIEDCPELARFSKWRMEEGENWFCNVVHKVWYPE